MNVNTNRSLTTTVHTSPYTPVVSQAMVSRSLRIKRETLSILEEEAKTRDMGITVYIRSVLENHAKLVLSVRELND